MVTLVDGKNIRLSLLYPNPSQTYNNTHSGDNRESGVEKCVQGTRGSRLFMGEKS
jgi:hypothetical protein